MSHSDLMIQQHAKTQMGDEDTCHACKDLLRNMEQFFKILEDARAVTSEWLTVSDVAKELKISRSVVYRLIRNGRLQAVDIVETDGHKAQRGHYRIRRSELEEYLNSAKTKATPDVKAKTHRSRRHPPVKNYLGL